MRAALACTLALAAVAAPGAAAREIEFENRGGLPLVEVRIGDETRTRTFVLDTGAHPCVLDDDLAESLGLPIGKPWAGRGGAGDFVANRLENVPVLVLAGGDAVRCRVAIAIDLHAVAKGLGHPLDGVIGADFFEGMRVTIDYDRGIVVRDTMRPRVAPDARIPITIEGRRPYLDAKLWSGPHRGAERRLLIDTGSMDGIVDALLDDSARTSEAAALGLGGGARIALGTFERVEIGPHAWSDVPGTHGVVSIVGGALLSRHNLVIDYRERWIALLPRSRD